MGARFRLGSVAAAAVLALGPGPLRAQDAPTTNAPTNETVGPRELQNFSLEGRRTQPASEAPATTASPPVTTGSPRVTEPRSRATARTSAADRPQPPAPQPERVSRAADGPPSSAHVPGISGGTSQAAAPAFQPAPPPRAEPAAAAPVFAAWPWLAAGLAALVAGLFFLRQRRGRLATEGASMFEAPVEAEVVEPPAPLRPAEPAPPPLSPAPAATGVVTTRLRPSLELAVQPLRCTVDEDRVAIDFELELFNHGSGPARGVLVDAKMFNASADQDQQIGAFFANPTGQGERLPVIEPMKRLSFASQILIPLEQLQLYDAGGRSVFVPLLAFNALFRWSGGDGQTSAAYLLGRSAEGEKMAPFRLDLGPRVFRGLEARPLPIQLRR